MDLGQRLLPEEIEKIESALNVAATTGGTKSYVDYLINLLNYISCRRDPKSIVAESLDQFIIQLKKDYDISKSGLLNMLAYHKKLNASPQSQDIATHLEREGVCDASSEVEQLRAERDAAINIALNERERVARYFDGDGFAAKALANGIRAIPAPVFPEARVHRAAIRSRTAEVAEAAHSAGNDWGVADRGVIEERAEPPVPAPWNRWLADALRHRANVDDGSGTTGPRQEASTRFAQFCRHLADKVLSEGADAFDWPPTPSELEVERLTQERDAARALCSDLRRVMSKARAQRDVAEALARQCRNVALGERERVAAAMERVMEQLREAYGAIGNVTPTDVRHLPAPELPEVP